MDRDELRELTVDEFHNRLRDGTTTVEAVVHGYLDRIKRYDRNGPALNAVLTVNPAASKNVPSVVRG